MAEKDESCFRAYYKHLKFAGKLNLFIILGITPITDLTMADITVAYNQALLHMQSQKSFLLPLTRKHRVSTARQVTEAWASLGEHLTQLLRLSKNRKRTQPFVGFNCNA